MIKVRIDKCENPNFWYSKMVEDTVFVKDNNINYLLLGSRTLVIERGDCTVISDTQPEPKGYCIKRTPENAPKLNEWLKLIGSGYNQNDGYVFSKPPTLSGCLVQSHKQFEGFAELHSVLEFFEKVGYKPEPVLIARAGEWVKIVDIGIGNLYDLVLNKGYQLLNDFFEGGELRFSKDEKGDTNGFSNDYIEDNGLKFERCSAPIEEVKESELGECVSFYSRYFPLFKHLNDEHGLLLLESEMQEIINVVNKIQE